MHCALIMEGGAEHPCRSHTLSLVSLRCSEPFTLQVESFSCHNAGLRSNFSSGMIYCSQITSNLLIKDMRINPACIRALPLDKEQVIEGIPVTLIDANHCPGAVLLLFKTSPPKGSVFSHEVGFS